MAAGQDPRRERHDSGPIGPAPGDVFPGDLDDSSSSGSWSVPWSDLMMVMFILFVVLYVTEAAEREILDTPTPLSALEPRVTTTAAILERSRQAVKEADVTNIDVVLQSDQSIKLSVKGPTFFELGSAELRPQTKDFLDRVAAVLRGNDRRVLVSGHTDSFPISSDRFPTNWELSAVRATTVVRYLIRRGDLEASRFEVGAHSMYRPAVANDSPDNKALNRRVEIVLLPEGT